MQKFKFDANPKPLKVEHHSVKEWIDFSMNPRTEEEIREACLDPEKRENLCISYICRYSNLSCEFIDELSLLSTFLIDKNTSKEEIKRIKSKLNKPAEESKMIRDKLDWTYICQYQKLTEEFMEAHLRELDWKMVKQYQNLSDKFKEKYKEELRSADRIVYPVIGREVL